MLVAASENKSKKHILLFTMVFKLVWKTKPKKVKAL